MDGGEDTAAPLSKAAAGSRPESLRQRIPWVTLVAVGAGLAASMAAKGGALLQYQRDLVERGEVWRPLTAHWVHWTPRMAIMDLGALLLLGAWLESRSRRLVLALFAGGALLIGLGVHLLMPEMQIYRGASGIASALFVAAALGLLARPGGGGSRWVVAGALGVFAAKVSWEALTGEALAAGPLPAGVGVAPRVHLLGAALGALAWLLLRRRLDPICERLSP